MRGKDIEKNFSRYFLKQTSASVTNLTATWEPNHVILKKLKYVIIHNSAIFECQDPIKLISRAYMRNEKSFQINLNNFNKFKSKIKIFKIFFFYQIFVNLNYVSPKVDKWRLRTES